MSSINSRRGRLVRELILSQNELIFLLEKADTEGSWNPEPGEWTFTEIAAHLAITEEECFAPRIYNVIRKDQPYFAYYDHTGRSFEKRPLREWLDRWIMERAKILEFVEKLSETQLGRIGHHEKEGPMTVLDLLEQMSWHDREHIWDLEFRLG